eukprot:jgi/Botrbrau1/12003/Bobra.247_2s0008.1
MACVQLPTAHAYQKESQGVSAGSLSVCKQRKALLGLKSSWQYTNENEEKSCKADFISPNNAWATGKNMIPRPHDGRQMWCRRKGDLQRRATTEHGQPMRGQTPSQNNAHHGGSCGKPEESPAVPAASGAPPLAGSPRLFSARGGEEVAIGDSAGGPAGVSPLSPRRIPHRVHPEGYPRAWELGSQVQHSREAPKALGHPADEHGVSRTYDARGSLWRGPRRSPGVPGGDPLGRRDAGRQTRRSRMRGRRRASPQPGGGGEAGGAPGEHIARGPPPAPSSTSAAGALGRAGRSSLPPRRPPTARGCGPPFEAYADGRPTTAPSPRGASTGCPALAAADESFWKGGGCPATPRTERGGRGLRTLPEGLQDTAGDRGESAFAMGLRTLASGLQWLVLPFLACTTNLDMLLVARLGVAEAGAAAPPASRPDSSSSSNTSPARSFVQWGRHCERVLHRHLPVHFRGLSAGPAAGFQVRLLDACP